MIEGGLCRESKRAIAVNAFYFHDRFVCLCTQITNHKSQKITEREIGPLFLPRAAFEALLGHGEVPVNNLQLVIFASDSLLVY